MSAKTKYHSNQSGFSLVEVLIGVFVFAVVALSIYQGFLVVLKVIKSSEAKTTAMLLANEQIEVIRNLPYKDVGLVAGVPAGLITRDQTITRNGMIFNVLTSVRNVDDPFDGQLGSTTKNDTASADYKMVELEIGCANCQNYSTTTIITTVAPKSLEGSSNNGALFVKVFDSAGQPVPQATVQIINASTSPNINITEVTDNTGVFQLVDAPTSSINYQIFVSKSGFSSSQTYRPGALPVYNPIDPHSTVVSGQVTQKSFAIDRTGELHIKSVDSVCGPVSSFAFHVRGDKVLGTDATGTTIYKFDQSYQTDAAGIKDLTGVEWDNYYFSSEDNSYDLAGVMPAMSMALAAGASQNVTFVMVPKTPNSLLVTVKDGVSGLPLDGAEVTLDSETLMTNRGFFSQTDWSGGGGQTSYTDESRFYSADSNIDFSAAGEAKLVQSLGQYLPAGYLVSSVFNTGDASTTFDSITWSPAVQPASTTVRFQIATGDDPATTTWDYLGPDGTESTYYTAVNTSINAVHNNHQYVRYKLYLDTADNASTPLISDVAITFSSVCIPFGQVLFNGLSSGVHTLSVSRTGYQTVSQTATTSESWQSININMNP